jgi:hypothetical protein
MLLVVAVVEQVQQVEMETLLLVEVVVMVEMV